MKAIKALFRKYLSKRWQWYYLVAAASLLTASKFGNDRYTGGADGAALGFAVFAGVCVVMAERLRSNVFSDNSDEKAA